MSCLSYFYQKSLKQTERGFSSFKLGRGCLRIPYGTLTVSSIYRYDIRTGGSCETLAVEEVVRASGMQSAAR